jgi:adenylate cyclase
MFDSKGEAVSMPKPYFEWVDENQKKHRLEVVDKIFIGRVCMGVDDTKCIIVKHRLISRDHAVITLCGSHLQITDTSKNGTWVNNVRLTAGSSQYLADGDEIRLGETVIRVRCPDLAMNDREDVDIDGTMVTPTNVIVTNLVADVRGFSTMTQTEDSSQIYALMKEIISTFSAIVHDYKGTIKDYVGDAIYAFWDHRFVPSKEQAVLACQAALKQAQTVSQIRSNLSGINPTVEYLRLGWGITTGKVTMSHYGSRAIDLALVGDCTNLAFRLSGIANKDLPSEIVICAETADLVRDTQLEVFDLGYVSVRGRSGKEHVFGIRQTE